MISKTTAMAAGLAAIFVAGSALAQGAPGQDYQGGYQGPPPSQGYQGPPPGYEGSYQHPRMHHDTHGVIALIKEEARAGRISKKEAMLLEGKIKQLHAERRAQRQARYYGERGAPSPQGQQ